VLLAIAVVWFVTPTSPAILRGLGVMRSHSANPGGGVQLYDLLSLSLTALNALFAGVGVLLTARGLRPRPQVPTTSGVGPPPTVPAAPARQPQASETDDERS